MVRSSGRDERPSMNIVRACSMVFSGQKPTTQSAMRPARSGEISRRNARAASSSATLEHGLVVDVVDRDLSVSARRCPPRTGCELHHPVRCTPRRFSYGKVHRHALERVEERGEQEPDRTRSDDVGPCASSSYAEPPGQRHRSSSWLARPRHRRGGNGGRAVERTGEAVQLDRHAGLHHAQRVRDALVAQRVELHRRHVCGRQSTQILRDRR